MNVDEFIETRERIYDPENQLKFKHDTQRAMDYLPERLLPNSSYANTLK
jgi:hypothetical protein